MQDKSTHQWHLARSLNEIECGIPESVHGLIDRKLQLLSEEDRRLLVCASIQGFEFDSTVVGTALGLDAGDTEDRLVRLDHVHGFVRPIRQTQFARQVPSLRYQFTHVLYQNALRELLSPSRRASLSAAVGGAMLQAYGEKSTAVASQLAMLFDAARDPSRAASHYLLAAQHASSVSADREAVTLARLGLSLLDGIPDVSRRNRFELLLQMILGAALIRLRGYADPGVKEAHSRAYVLCRHSEDNLEIYRALMGLGAYHIFRSELATGREIWERLLRLGEASQNRLLLLWSCTTGSIILSHIGEQTASLEFVRRGLDAYDPKDHDAIVALGGFDAGIIGRAQAARILWLCGYPDEARTRAEEALAMARHHSHPYTLGLTLFFTAWACRFLRDTTASTERAVEAISIAEEYGFRMLQGWSEGLLGWDLAEQGRLEEGLSRLRGGLNILRSIGCRLIYIEFLGLLAEVHSRRGETADAVAMLDEALLSMEDGGEHYYEAELYRTRAEILQKNLSTTPDAEVESLLQKSLYVSRSQGSKSFELRAAMALSRHYLETGKEDACRILSATYGWFNEGFDTPDLREARRVLSLCQPAVDTLPHA